MERLRDKTWMPVEIDGQPCAKCGEYAEWWAEHQLDTDMGIISLEILLCDKHYEEMSRGGRTT